ncbi:hypothetical protein FGG08_007086 [Glutinoglossum americanum]|uniref:Hemerythrin-like domain-containing protein n=1 Tax=Glutinoglossum americanum TaxID=1670608 RepID=A0A9P8HUQ5_9PEZI|nr:hypothetical protein FGG08_007086 [Glutinoglossum americanum]
MFPDSPKIPFRLITSTGAKSRSDIPQDHYCRRNAQVMALTHNTIFRGLNAIYHQAPHVLPGTQNATDLLFYCAVAYDFIHNHHVTEESTYFPEIEKAAGIPGLMNANIEQHRSLEAGLELFRKYAEETPKEAYNADKLRRIIDGLAGPLGDHLHEEIPTILDLHDKVSSAALRRAYSHMHNAAEKSSNGFKTGPFVLGCQDADFLLDGEEAVFPEVPWFVPYIVDYAVARRHAGAWRFNPSDMHGRARRGGASAGSSTSPGSRLFVFVGWRYTPPVFAMLCSLAVACVAVYLASAPIPERLLRGRG